MSETRGTVKVRGEKRTTRLPAVGGGARIVEIAGEELGASHPIRDELVIGRDPENGVAIVSPGVSRRHARISREAEDAFAIEDLGSRNGTLVNGVPIHGKHPIVVGDRLQLGADVVFLFTRADPVEAHLAHLRRMEVVGRLTASVVHDFNNLLGVMLASLEHLEGLGLDAHLPDQDASDSVEDALEAARDAADLTRRLLAVARPARLSRDRVSLKAIMDNVVRMAGRMCGDDVRIAQASPRELYVLGDETDLVQVLMNLCVNARDAMPEGGTLALSAGLLDLSIHAPPIPLTSGYAVVIVKDDGVGMDSVVRERIFDPFFTTKGEGQGSGLGLATVYASVRRMGGHIDVDSEPGRGTKVTLYLPLASRRPTTETATISRRPSLDDATGEARPLTVVIAADDAMNRRAIRRLSRKAGYEARAFDQREAREILEAKILTPDLVIFDPDSSEKTEGVERIVEAAGDAPVMMLAAYLSAEEESMAQKAGVSLVVRKPLGAKELEAAILAALFDG